jgi:putative drug exporter of the RND superfamily
VAALLYRVGRFAFRFRWVVVVVWVAALGGVFAAASHAAPAPADNNSIPGAEFQQANDLLQRAFHANPNGATAQIVFVAPHGQKITAARYQPVISKVVAEAARSPQVQSAQTPSQDGEVSRDGSTAIAEISYTAVQDKLTTATTNTLKYAAQLGRDSGLTVEVGGDALNTPFSDTAAIYGLAVALVVLLVTFGSLAAAGLPLLTAGIGVALGLLGISAREREVMALAAEGYSNDEVGARLFLSTNTVRTHVQWAMMKLHARDRAQLVVIAYQTGLVRPALPPR